ncbi:MAG: peptidyl-prolyl cis-trans isomerase [Syntrophotaleaceae bacterium]
MSRGRNPYLILLVLFALLLAACQEPDKLESSVLLRVNGRITTLDQFQGEVSRLMSAENGMSKERRKELERSLLAQKIDREIVLEQADQAGIQIPVEQLQSVVEENLAEYSAGDFEQMLREQHLTIEEWRRQLEENLRIEAAARRLAYDRITITEQEIADYYREHREEFNHTEQVRTRQIAVGSEDEGQRVLGLLHQGMDFGDAAQKFSRSPDAEQGGDLGFFSRGEMPVEFDQVVFSLPPGRISDLVHSEYGFHIFLVEERRPARRMSLAEVRDEIIARLRETKEEKAYQDWLQALRSQASIEVDWSLL